MRLTIPPLDIDEEEPFNNDLFERKAFGERLLNIACNTNEPLVISLDAQWGEGKTTFIKMWKALLTKEDIPNVYIDAYANDYTDDPFISVVSAISSYAQEHAKKGNESSLDKLKDKAKKAGVQLVPWATKIAIKAATLGAIRDSDFEGLDDIKKDLSKGASDLVGDFIGERLDHHEESISVIESFKEELSQLTKHLAFDNDFPLVVIIDELDRCKPTFAVEMIERVKHLFSVENVVFVLAMHKGQLEESVKCVYGQGIDAHTYLQKFINLDAKLPKRTTERYQNDLRIYNSHLLNVLEIETWDNDRDIVECIEVLSNYFNISLRQLENVYQNISIIYGAISKNHLRLPSLITFTAMIRVVRPDLFSRLQNNSISYVELESEISSKGFNRADREKGEDGRIYAIMNWVRYSLFTQKEFSSLPEDDEITQYHKAYSSYNAKRRELLSHVIRDMCMFDAR